MKGTFFQTFLSEISKCQPVEILSNNFLTALQRSQKRHDKEESQYENFKYLEKIHVVGILIFSHTNLCICVNAISLVSLQLAAQR